MLLASPTFGRHPATALHLADAVQLRDARSRDLGHVQRSFWRAELIEPQNAAQQLWPQGQPFSAHPKKGGAVPLY